MGAAAGAPAAQGSGGDSAAPGIKVPSRIRLPAPAGLQSAASAPAPAATAITASCVPAGLKPIRTSLPNRGNGSALGGLAAGRQASAPSAFLEAAMSEPQLGPSTTCMQPTAAGVSGSSWLAGPADLDHALSCSDATLGNWENWAPWEASSPRFAGGLDVADNTWEDGSLSPALITAPNAAGGMLGHCLSSSPEDWWLGCNSPTGAFTAAGLAGL